MKRLAIVTTHPVQYNAPWFRELAARSVLDVKVFYTWHAGNVIVRDEGFAQTVQWDIPLLEGYSHELTPPKQFREKRTYRNMNSPSLISKLHAWNPDSILVIGWNFKSHLRCMKHFHGKRKILFRGDSTLLRNTSFWKRIVRKVVLRHVYNYVDVALAVGTNNREYFRYFGLANSQIAIVPHAIDNVRFGNQEFDSKADSLRKDLGLTDDDLAVAFIGKLDPIKSPVELLRAFEVAQKCRSSLKLVMIGSGILEPVVDQMAQAIPNVIRLPFQNQSNIPIAYRLGDINCLPSRSETWGLCVNESMASGRAVLASDNVGAAIDLIHDGKTGFITQMGMEALVRALVNLPSKQSLREMGEACKKYIQPWSFENICKSITSIVVDDQS